MLVGEVQRLPEHARRLLALPEALRPAMCSHSLYRIADGYGASDHALLGLEVQLHERQVMIDRRIRDALSLGDRLLGHAVLVAQALIASCSLDRVEVLAVRVLDKADQQ